MTFLYILAGIVVVAAVVYQVLPLSRKRFLRNLGAQIKFLIPRYFV